MINLSCTETIEYKNLISDAFVDLTRDLKNLYIKIKKECEISETHLKTPKDISDFISYKGKEYFPKLKQLYQRVWKTLISLGLENADIQINPIFQIYKSYFQKEIHQYFLISPFCERVFNKPLGYAGDFVMMQFIYDNALEGKSLFAKLIHNFSVNLEVARAVRLRKNYIVSKMERCIKARHDSTLSFSSVACGPAVEIDELIPADRNLKININLLDSESRAIAYVKQHLHLKELRHSNFSVNYYNNSILDIITNKVRLEKQDLIYSLGLFDYLLNKLAIKLIERLFASLEKGGTLIVGNLKANKNVLRAYMELLGEWFLHYRNEEDLVSLTHDINDKAKISIEKDSLGVQLYLIIEKV